MRLAIYLLHLLPKVCFLGVCDRHCNIYLSGPEACHKRVDGGTLIQLTSIERGGPVANSYRSATM